MALSAIPQSNPIVKIPVDTSNYPYKFVDAPTAQPIVLKALTADINLGLDDTRYITSYGLRQSNYHRSATIHFYIGDGGAFTPAIGTSVYTNPVLIGARIDGLFLNGSFVSMITLPSGYFAKFDSTIGKITLVGTTFQAGNPVGIQWTADTSQQLMITTTPTPPVQAALSRYWGFSSNAAQDSATVISAVGGGTDHVTAKEKTSFSIRITGTDDYIFYAYPTSYGDLTSIIVQNFESINAFNLVVLPVTVNSVTTNYNVYTTKNSFGASTITITSAT